MKNLTGKVAVITGAAGGIGKALTEKFLRQGATVWALDHNGSALKEIENQSIQH